MNTPDTKPGSTPHSNQQPHDPRSGQPKDRPPGQMQDPKDKTPKPGRTGQQGGSGSNQSPPR